MGDLRPWHIVVMVLGVLVLGGSLYFQLTDETKILKIADRVTVVDVDTGDLFEAPFPSGRAVIYPAKSPVSGNLAIFPVEKDGDKWVIPSRFRDQVREFYKGKKETGKVNLSDGEVTVANAAPKSASIF